MEEYKSSIDKTALAISCLKMAYAYLPKHMMEKRKSIPELVRIAEDHLKDIESGLKEYGK